MNLRFVTKSNCVCMCALYHSRQQEELGQLQAELHDAESADDGIYGALRAQDRGAAVDTTATQGLGPHGSRSQVTSAHSTGRKRPRWFCETCMP